MRPVLAHQNGLQFLNIERRENQPERKQQPHRERHKQLLHLGRPIGVVVLEQSVVAKCCDPGTDQRPAGDAVCPIPDIRGGERFSSSGNRRTDWAEQVHSLSESSRTFSAMPKPNRTARAAAFEEYVCAEFALCCGTRLIPPLARRPIDVPKKVRKAEQQQPRTDQRSEPQIIGLGFRPHKRTIKQIDIDPSFTASLR